MKLIVGLGNPGKEYEKTRHNIGFLAIDEMTTSLGLTTWKKKFDGLYLDTVIGGEKVIFLKPQRYMNLSGEVIIQYLQFFHIAVPDFLVIHDDLDLPIGVRKLKYKGSSGGHNGLKNIELHLKTQDYQRFKIGVSNDKTVETKNYVLGTLSKEEWDKLMPILSSMPSFLEDYLALPFEKVMSKYNQSK